MEQNHKMQKPPKYDNGTARRAPGIGESPVRADAMSKALGGEIYSCDFYAPDMLWAGVKRAGVPHALLKGVSCEKARAVKGVAAVLTHHDVKGTNRQGVARKDQPVLVDHKVRHRGDAVALVVAADPETLARALDLVEMDLEPLPAVFDPDEALSPSAPLIHEDHAKGNLLLSGEVTKGRGAAALDDCPVVVEGVFHLPRQEHAYLETEAGWALWDEEKGLEVSASTQTPFRDLAEVADALGLNRDRLRIKAPYPGGAFGGKDGVSIQSLLGLAALAVPGRPVKMWLDREESFLFSPKRHPARLSYRLGAEKDGSLKALEADLQYDTGPYDHLGGVVMALGLEHAGGAYDIPHAELKGRAVYTNNPVGGAFRGFGVPQANAAMEGMMERLAMRLGMDPLALRQKNILHKGSATPVGVELDCSVGLADCLDAARRHQIWTGREKWKAGAGRHKLRGVGLSLALHGMGYGPVVPDVAGAKLELTPKGSFRVYCGVVDMGQGNVSTYLHMAAHLLNQDLGQMEPVLPDTARTLPSGSSSASRTTFTFGNALVKAAGKLEKRILERAAEMLETPAENLCLSPGRVGLSDGSRLMPLAEVAASMTEEQRFAEDTYQAPVSSQRPSPDELLTMHGLPHCIFGFGAMLCAMEVDRLTGRVELKSLAAFCDVGRVINPRLLEQQIQGGVAQGLGYALWERMRSQEGALVEKDLSTYIIPGACDLPDLDFEAVESFEPQGPFGMKGAGELPTDLPLPAVAAAITDACGAPPFRFPVLAEDVLELLEGCEGEAPDEDIL